MAFPPEPYELLENKIGYVVVNTITDRPWSQQFCCMVTGNLDFVRKHPLKAHELWQGEKFCDHSRRSF